MKKVLLIGGSKQSGKTSAANFITGYKMQESGDTTGFEITDGGELRVNATFINPEGKEVEGVADLNLSKHHEFNDATFVAYAQEKVWPNARICNVADALKETLALLFDVPIDKLYGNNEDKNLDTIVYWNNVAKFFKGAGVKKLKTEGMYDRNLTIRELCQQFSDFCRTFDENCFVRPCGNEIIYSPYELYLVPDGRFKNEVEFFDNLASEGYFELRKIYLKRRIDNDEHEGENLDKHYDIDKFDAVIDNTDITIHEKNQLILEKLCDWNWVTPKD